MYSDFHARIFVKKKIIKKLSLQVKVLYKLKIFFVQIEKNTFSTILMFMYVLINN